MSHGYPIVCYYFPNYHLDPRNEACTAPGGVNGRWFSAPARAFPDIASRVLALLRRYITSRAPQPLPWRASRQQTAALRAAR